MDSTTSTNIGSTMCQSVSPSRCNHVASIGREEEAMPPTSNHPRSTAKIRMTSAARKKVGRLIPVMENTVTL